MAKTKLFNLSDLKPNTENPRFITDEKLEELKNSLGSFKQMMEIRPIVYDEDMVILGGNMRYSGLIALKKRRVPHEWVKQVTGLTPEQKKEFIIKDNVGFGEWDWDALHSEWDTEKLEEWGLEVEPFAEDIVLPAEDDDYQAPAEIYTDIVEGDLIEIGPHRILCGDSTSADAMDKLMEGKKADLAHNDPPYGMKKEKDGVQNDNLNYDDLLKFNQDWVPLQFTHLKKNGSFYCWGIDEPLMDLYHVILRPYKEESALSFRNLITWDKGAGQGQNSELTRSYATADEKCLFVMMGKQDMAQNKDQFPEEWRSLLEYFVIEKNKMGWSSAKVVEITGKTSASHYFTESQFALPTAEAYKKMQDAADGKAFKRDFQTMKKEGNGVMDEFYASRAYFNNVHDNMNNVWHFDRHIRNGDEGGHATPKPIPLCSRVINSSCPEGGLVIDAFLGSGSTMVAAHQLDRVCYGMELSENYCQVIIDRMLKLDDTLTVKINGKKYKKK